MTEDKAKGGIRHPHRVAGHFTKHHVKKLLRAIKGDEAPSEQAKQQEQMRRAAERSTQPSHDDDVTSGGEGVSEAMSLDCIRNWKAP